jgi:hypothetical protein
MNCPVVGSKAVVLACLLALALAGCGTGGREDDAAAVAESFHAALEQSDGKAACAKLNPQTASTLEQDEQKPCEEAITSLDIPKGGTVADTRVYLTSAFASLAEGTVDFLDKSSEGWWVSAAGCSPTASGQPYDCELEN